MLTNAFFYSQVVEHNAVKVKFGLLRQGEGRLPSPHEVLDRAIWFETQNFGFILSPKVNGKRTFLLRY